MKNFKYKPIPLRKKILDRIENSEDTVFLTKEFLDLSDSDQVIRALRELIAQNKLLKIGKGVYAKARLSMKNEPMIADPKGFGGAARNALSKLKVFWRESKAVEDYNAGLSTQVPLNLTIRIKGKLPRKLFFKEYNKNYEVKYEQIS